MFSVQNSRFSHRFFFHLSVKILDSVNEIDEEEEEDKKKPEKTKKGSLFLTGAEKTRRGSLFRLFDQYIASKISCIFYYTFVPLFGEK